MFEKFRKSNKSNKSLESNDIMTIEMLMDERYKLRYFKACKYIWKNYVPASGQSDVLQGELLRQLEKLRYEAQGNGNRNWDEGFDFFCDFLKETLCSQEMFSVEEKEKFALILNYLKECGNYAMRWRSGQVSDDEVDMNRIAYTQDNLYDMVADAIGQFHLKVYDPIPYEKNENVFR